MKFLNSKIVFLILFFLPFLSFAQLNKYTVNELDRLLYNEQRPVLFFIKTDWCSICLGMENSVLSDNEVAKVLNEHFYLVILDAESKEDIVFKGKRYKFESSGINQGKHQLAMSLVGQNETLSFPSTVVLLGRNKLYQSNSFIAKKDFLKILKNIRDALEE